MRKIDNDVKLDFKKDLSNIELMGIEHILNKIGTGYEYALPTDAEVYGLAYTSSSSYAMHNVTEHVVFDDLTISHFAITENDMLIMVCSNNEDDYYYYEIESQDY